MPEAHAKVKRTRICAFIVAQHVPKTRSGRNDFFFWNVLLAEHIFPNSRDFALNRAFALWPNTTYTIHVFLEFSKKWFLIVLKLFFCCCTTLSTSFSHTQSFVHSFSVTHTLYCDLRVLHVIKLLYKVYYRASYRQSRVFSFCL